MTTTLVDSNVILDIATEDPRWLAWSSDQLARCVADGRLFINPLIYAEVSIGFARIEELEDALPHTVFQRQPLPYEAGISRRESLRRIPKAGGQPD